MSESSRDACGRRQFIKGTGLAAAAGMLPLAAPARAAEEEDAPAAKVAATETAPPGLPRVWGANYVPSRRMNTYQCWWRFDPEQLEREIGYATRIKLNALRMWLSYERWVQAPQETEQQVDTLLAIAHKHGVRILLSLFSGCGGIDPTPGVFNDESPTTGYEHVFPSFEVMHTPSLWGKPREYIDWYMGRYGNDARLLAVEVMNEPNGKANEFAAAMLEHAAARRGALRLTIGSISLKHNLLFVDRGMDVLQSHPNFLHSEAHFEEYRAEAEALIARFKMEYWASEWQRIRKGNLGWDRKFVQGDEWKPQYRSLAPLFQRHRIGGFFWSLMLRPSFLKIHPTKRWMNGVFHPDGTVYSLADARSIANDPKLQMAERADWPDWAADVAKLLEAES